MQPLVLPLFCVHLASTPVTALVYGCCCWGHVVILLLLQVYKAFLYGVHPVAVKVFQVGGWFEQVSSWVGLSSPQSKT